MRSTGLFLPGLRVSASLLGISLFPLLPSGVVSSVLMLGRCASVLLYSALVICARAAFLSLLDEVWILTSS